MGTRRITDVSALKAGCFIRLNPFVWGGKPHAVKTIRSAPPFYEKLRLKCTTLNRITTGATSMSPQKTNSPRFTGENTMSKNSKTGFIITLSTRNGTNSVLQPCT